jgi:hypothetical protein
VFFILELVIIGMDEKTVFYKEKLALEIIEDARDRRDPCEYPY